ncbi:MAG: BatD family protein [Pseudomonadota bacterium]|nr:BatD family protein [Pseudomonadota bacterium]
MKRVIVFCALLTLAALAHAAGSPASSGQGLRAFLDRGHVSLGDTVTLNIQGAGALSGTPDLSPLQSDFDVLGTSSSSSVQLVNGNARSTTQLGIALRPRRTGTLVVPPLNIDGLPTPPLTLHVAPAPGGTQGAAGGAAFLEASVDTASPYVGQQIVYTLRLYYAPGLTGGQLDDPQADGAQLVHLDSDTRYQTQRGGETYQVVERHYALIPQRAGSIVVHGPAFQGQMLGTNTPDSMFDSLFDDGKPVEARANELTLDARAIPASGGTPWLPAQSVQLKLDGLPADGNARVGEPLTVTLRIDAVGATAQRLPEPQLPPIDGARVYPDRTQDATSEDENWLHGTRTRSFAILPGHGGTLTIPAITLNWWDAAHDRAAQANIPARIIHVSGAVANGATSSPPSSNAPPPGNVIGPIANKTTDSLWRGVARGSLALWVIVLTALAWWWLSKRDRGALSDAVATPPRADARHLRQRTLDAALSHDAARCERALMAWARETKSDLRNPRELRDALTDPVQRGVLDALEYARWNGGDAAAACGGIAREFERGFRWREVPAGNGRADDGLPPLYP